ncbi:hypothetical protein BCR44DRAFT_1393110 [Catenaria anguillulae PL171]|uniref:Ubiquitin carboxyl-terminal hydrolase n=1 Tax=Catenaria anguillulae PL171 TaxID=765915 RepID=A0A1Y2H8D6_9FUNG|nr:hypothetical protein BCR44DRAFT_1393110 [Catenaria anguillulae PL171]
MSPCTHISRARAPPASANVYKDECTQCFNTWDHQDGVDVCLTCFNSGCGTTHSLIHAQRTGHPLAVNLRRTPKIRDSSPPPKMTKLAIAAESDADKFDMHTKVKCFDCNEPNLTTTNTPLPSIVDAVLKASSASMQNEVKAWELELEACEHTVCLEQTEAKRLDATTAHCGQCDLKENLWLCLTCGHLGCGRAQYGGLAGNGHALAHATSCSGHSVAVKLGTITPDGGADVYCYACNDERLDPYLADHMARFGVNLAQVVKTEKSLVEMQIEQNLKFEFEMTSADGQNMPPVAGPWLRGLANLGNSCYLASVVQCMFRIPEMRDRYLSGADEHQLTCSAASHAECWECQWIKLARGLAEGGKVPDPSLGHGNAAVTPAMFKHMVAKGHKEFSGMRQQDASEFLQYLLKQIAQHERMSAKSDPSQVFDFKQLQTIRCLQCQGVRVAEMDASVVNLMVPDEALKAALAKEKEAQAAEEAAKGQPEAAKKADAADGFVTVDAAACLRQAMSETVEFDCPRCAKRVQGIKTTGFKTFPKYLAIVSQRFTYDNWVPKKSNVHVAWPHVAESHAPQDLSFLHVSVGPNDHVLQDAPAAPQPDSPELEQLLSFGLPRGKARRALRLNGNNLEAALNWAMDNPEDVDEAEEDAIQRGGGSAAPAAPAADEGAISMLADMGFTRSQALLGLLETGNNVERAIEWLFSHPDELANADNAIAGGAGAGEAAAAQTKRSDVETETARYALEMFINHKGPSMHCGHYIAHVTVEDGKWVMLNDDRVVVNPSPKGLLEEAYVYVLRRLD